MLFARAVIVSVCWAGESLSLAKYVCPKRVDVAIGRVTTVPDAPSIENRAETGAAPSPEG